MEKALPSGRAFLLLQTTQFFQTAGTNPKPGKCFGIWVYCPAKSASTFRLMLFQQNGIPINRDIQWGACFQLQAFAKLFGKYNASQMVYTAHDTGVFHGTDPFTSIKDAFPLQLQQTYFFVDLFDHAVCQTRSTRSTIGGHLISVCFISKDATVLVLNRSKTFSNCFAHCNFEIATAFCGKRTLNISYALAGRSKRAGQQSYTGFQTHLAALPSCVWQVHVYWNPYFYCAINVRLVSVL